MNRLIDLTKLEHAAREFRDAKPFNHAVIDGFFPDDFAHEIAAEFPAFDGPVWHHYDNPLEVKRTCNNWNAFGPATYQALTTLNSAWLTATLSRLFGPLPLFSDPGLNGGGLHIHGRGGKLNPHLDYVLHPKTGLARKLNVLVYMTPDWREEWGGHLALWKQHESERKPGELTRRIAPLFNRAVIFDTTQQSWHGLPEPIDCPEDVYRRSLAAYYMTTPARVGEDRKKALFAPTEAQADDPAVYDLIRRRAELGGAAGAYRTERTPT